MPFSVPMSSGRQISEITTAQFGTIGIYSNKDEIKQAMDAASARIAAERKANLNHAVAALTQSWVTAIRGRPPPQGKSHRQLRMS